MAAKKAKQKSKFEFPQQIFVNKTIPVEDEGIYFIADVDPDIAYENQELEEHVGVVGIYELKRVVKIRRDVDFHYDDVN